MKGVNQEDGLKITKESISQDSFTGYDPGPMESNSGFPRAFILLPDLSKYKVSQATIDITYEINGVPKGLVAQQDRNGKWVNYKGSEIKYLRISLLEAGNKNVQAEIIVGAENIINFSRKISLNKDTKYNPFIGIYALHIGPSSLPWAKIQGSNPAGVYENIDIIINSSNNERVARLSLSPQDVAGSSERQPPEARIVLIPPEHAENSTLKIETIRWIEGEDVTETTEELPFSAIKEASL